MARTLTPPAVDATLEPTERDLSAIIQLVYQRSGITLHPGKRELVTARLQKRVRGGGFASFAAYLAHVQADRTGQAMTTLLDAIATNHTHFFRESRHFDFLAEHAAQLRARRPGGVARGLVGGVLDRRGALHDPDAAARGRPRHGPPARLRHLHQGAGEGPGRRLSDGQGRRRAAAPAAPLLREGPRRAGGLARVALPLRQQVDFRALNLLEITSLGRQFDFIFCRNVMIYFDKATQQKVVTMLERHLKPGGDLFIAHSESLNGIAHGLEPLLPAVFRKRV